VRENPEASLEGLAIALADACEAQAPPLSLEQGRAYEPQRDLARARAAFDVARQAAMRVAKLAAP